LQNTVSNLTPLAAGAEFDKIRSIWRVLGARAVGGGDDCAIVRVGDEQIAVSTDMALEGTHFREGWLTPAEIGWRATAAALSDLAAVAAEPRGVLVSLALSPEWHDDFVGELMDGVGEVAASVGAKVWGGDVVRGERLTIDVAVVGSVTNPVLRSTAGPGDRLWVTGRLGGPLAAVESWEAGQQPEETARERFARPEPRIEQAFWLRDHDAKALIDVSDGLLSDAGQLAAASSVSCAIEASTVPWHPAVTNETTALLSGEEFELLVALPHDSDADLSDRFVERFGLELTCVGRIEAGSGVALLRDGESAELPQGFRHF
jgi:thiamine-monophosphate kinase